MDRKLKAVIIVYILVFIIIYGTTLISFSLEYLSLLSHLFISISIVFSLFLLIYIISRYFLEVWSPKQVGWTTKNFSKSFLWASAPLLPFTLSLLIASYIFGTGTVMMWLDIGIEPPYPLWIPLFGIVYWLLGGIIAFSFWQAFSYECLEKYPKKYVIPVISVLFILLYNQPLITGDFNPIDIIWLGIIFLLIYYKFQNSLSLVVSYVFLFEGPVIWCFGVIFGDLVVLIILYIKTIWCIVAVLILIFQYLKNAQKVKEVKNSEI